MKPEDVWPSLQQALAQRNYFPAKATAQKPTQLLVFHWGFINYVDLDQRPSDYELKAAMNLVGGSRVAVETPEWTDLWEHISEDRYFIVVSAYDYSAAKAKQKKPLWRTRMSVPVAGTSLQASIKPMIRISTPYFGTDTKEAVHSYEMKEGRVEIGEIRYPEPPNAPNKGK